MDERSVFAAALGLNNSPWYVESVTFDRELRRLDIHLEYAPRTKFQHPRSNELVPVYDTLQRTWRHLNFFQFECYLHAFVPRVDDGVSGGGVAQVPVPWARPGSGFTLLMEAMMVFLAGTGMTVAEAAEAVGEYPQRLWRVLHHHVPLARAMTDFSQVTAIGVDEVCRTRGQDYLTVVSEVASTRHKARVLVVVPGRESKSVAEAQDDLAQHGLKPEQVRTVCTDFSAAYLKGVKETYPEARQIFDNFHLMKLAGEAVDKVRRRERKSFPDRLKGTRWLWLKRPERLTPEETTQLAKLRRSDLQTGRAYNYLDSLRSIMSTADPEKAERALWQWTSWVLRGRIPEMKEVARTIRRHWEGIVAYLWTRINNGTAEALNGIIQTVKRKSRGFRTIENFRLMIYLVASRLTFFLPIPVPFTHMT
jgi:transposase